ncbi:putative Zn-dependent peptidase [Abditibacterium utsteinense]|uniref:Putative Zn-dependent peptidase n=1 Tax=Abditibacterium utsteinense TaxID=1960156 RepID=A0A2S8SSQ0_9BACT|nr:pitrilysin family protein [Abditibacterium utsteinense]PQV63842.1 putative Zn-dependent peptidase [Abditibacterium utsteinense]
MNRYLLHALLCGAPFLSFSAARAQAAAPSMAASPTKSAPATKNEADASFHAATLLSPAQISLKTLQNGVRGIVKSASGSDLVSIQIWVRAGSRTETTKESGAAHLMEILALRGSKGFPAGPNGDDGGALGAIRALGGDAGSLTSRDSTFYSATVAAPFAARAIGIMADAVLRPDLSLSAVEDAKVQAGDDVSRRAFDPVSGAADLAYSVAFAKHPYRRAAIGSENSVGALNQKIARAFYGRQYVGKNISVVVVGQIGSGEAQRIIARTFGAASNRAPIVTKTVSESPLKLDVVARRRIVSREVIDLGWRSPGIDKPNDCVALDMILSLWREGIDANLRRILLRDGDKGPLTPLVASYDVDYLTQKDSGLFLISLVDPQDREAAVEAILSEVKRIGENGVSEAELRRAKEQLRDQYIDQGATVAGQAGALGFYDTIASYRFATDYLSRCSKITASDLQRVAQKYLVPDRYVRTEISPLPRPRPEDDNGNSGPVITAKYHANSTTRLFVQ